MSCGSALTCSECYNTSVLCHWCAADQQCHVKGSIYGCGIGTDCLSGCVRQEPESWGFGAPTEDVIGIALLVAVIVLCLPVLSWTYLSRRKKKRDRTQQLELQQQRSSSERDPSYFLLSSFSQPLSSTTHGDNDVAAATDAERRSDGASHKEQMCYNLCRCVSITALVVVVPATVVAILYYPQALHYSVCNKQFDWLGLLLHPTGTTVQVLYSVYNPNRIRIDFSEAYASISYKGTEVASGSLKPGEEISLPAGSVIDLYVNNQVHAGSFGILEQMLQDYYRSTLFVDVYLQIAAQAFVLEHQVKTVNASYTYRGVDFGAPADRTYCYC